MVRRKRTHKPSPDFPLFLHATGQWAKKIRGKLVYFGTDAAAALKKFKAEEHARLAGLDPRATEEAITLLDLVNRFLTRKREKMEAGEMTGQAWGDYHRACAQLLEQVDRYRPAKGVGPDDFAAIRAAAAKRFGPAALSVYITQVRMVFKFGFAEGLLPVPVRFGSAFDKPPRRVLRLTRAAGGPKLITPGVAWSLIHAADVQLRAMIFLGLNCGFGQSDCARLTRGELGIRPGWIDAPRGKTGAPRRALLWPETLAALAEVGAARPAPLDPANDRLVFITPKGHPWIYWADKGTEKRGARIDAVRARFDTTRERAGVKVPGGFYTLRHTFRTVADEVKDQPAAGLVMGHTDLTIAAHYREAIGDDRLKAVTEHVRAWLLAGRK